MQQKIVFSKKRDFGSVIGDAFQFTMRNFKSLITGFLLYVGPFIMIGIIGEIMAFRSVDLLNMVNVDFLSLGAGVFVFIVFIAIAAVMLLAFTFGAIQKYQDEPEEPIIEGMWPYVRRNIGRMAIFTLALIAAYVVVFGFVVAISVGIHVALGIVLGLILFPLVVYCSVPLAIAPYIYIDEDLTLVEAVKKSFFLVRGYWWITFAIILVLGLIAGAVSSVFLLPVYVAFIVSMVSSAEMMTGEPTMPGMWFGIIYAVAILSSMLVRIYQLIGTVLQYYHLKEVREGTSLIQRIEDLEVDG